MSKKQMGFTLIEIVMVLVLLGILSAVAVPKYFDLRDQAELQAAKATVAEFQARLNARFAQNLLKDMPCSTTTTTTGSSGARYNAISATLADTDFGGWTVAGTAPTDDTTTTMDITVTNKTSTNTYPTKVPGAKTDDFKITLPKCN